MHGPDSACASLFAFHAQRLGVALQPDDAPLVQTIAERIEGHPLALELAASWLPALPVAEIVDELERGLAFLADEDVATIGHRSLRAVFMRSWELLTPRLREVLPALTVFVGGASHDAARRVCGAQHNEMLRLVGKSLLRRSDEGRFTLHPVVHQFAAKELSATRRAALLKAHAEYFLMRVANERGVGLGRMDPAASRRLETDFENVRQACRTALWLNRLDLMEAAHRPLEALLGMLGHTRESIELWGLAIDALPQGHASRPRLQLNRVAAWIAMGKVIEAERQFQVVGPQVQSPEDLALFYNARSTAAAWRGEHEQARAHAQAALQAAQASNDPFELMRAQLNVALTEWVAGNVDPAEPLALAALALAEAHGATVFRAQALRLLSSVRVQQHRFDEARTLLAASSEYFAAIGDDYEVAYNERVASGQARKVGDAQRQLAHALRAVSALEELGVPVQYVASLVELSLAREAVGDADEASALMHQALTLAMRLRHMPLMLTTIGQAARLHAVRGSHAALGWLAFVLGQSSLRVDIRSELKPIFERLVPAAAQRAALLAARAHASVGTICGEMLAAHHDARAERALP